MLAFINIKKCIFANIARLKKKLKTKGWEEIKKKKKNVDAC